MKDCKELLTTTKKKLKRELTPQEEHFLKWLQEEHLKELQQRKINEE